MTLPTLSVVIPNYNHARFLPEALHCVLGQSVRPLEVIVVDDASSDNSVEVVREFARREPSVKLLCNRKNRGVSASVNRGMRLAAGDYVYSGAADDKVVPGFFGQALEMAARHPQSGMIFGEVVKVDDDGNVLGHYAVSRWPEPTYASPERFLHDYLLVEPPTHSLCGATMYRRDCFLEMGGYRGELGSWSDTFVARAVGLQYGAGYLARPGMY